MRLVKLSVHRFQCIEAAELELGPGLNVLYGPNDLGKSSLAWAIRAVLLLQHGSSQHERFVSWYGGGEPRVSLTFTDAEERYWRVEKTFDRSRGRSVLETSKDGRVFTSDSSGRQVDEKLRKLLGWGIQPPGGAGSGRGFPDSFLTHVLLSEQDSVRKVLFDSSLTRDSDESGRRRLTEALGALAEDPLFKKVLDDAQAFVDRAFTATGRKKRSAGSPFVEVAERIKAMQEERDELEGKVRDTVAAEAKIRALVAHRDETARELGTARATLAEREASLVVARRRDLLVQQLEGHRAKLAGAEALRGDLQRAQALVDELQAEAARDAARLEELTATAARDAEAHETARQRLDAIALGEGASDHERSSLEDQLHATEERLKDAERGLERAKIAERDAIAAAEAVALATAAIAPLAAASRDADDESEAATDREQRAAERLERAKQRLLEATSGDRVRARELRRAELANRRLVRAAERATIAERLRLVSEATELANRAKSEKEKCDAGAKQLALGRAALASVKDSLAALDATKGSLELLERFGRLRLARAEAATAADATSRASRERARAESLRAEEATLRATLREGLPTSAEVAELRSLRDELRVAEASLGGGLSVTIRPRRELTATTSADGVSSPPRPTRAPLTVSASRSLSLTIDDLVDLEITAGEEAARTHAATLRARWAAAGASALRSHGVDTVEALEALLRDAEAIRREANDRRRDADAAEQEATRHVSGVDLEALAARISELEQALGVTDAADQADLEARLDALGPRWETALQRQLAEAASERESIAAKLDAERERLARSEARLESETRAAEALRAEAERKEAELGEALPILEARAKAELGDVDRELEAIEAQLAALTGDETENATARAEIATAEQELADCAKDRQVDVAAAQRAREALVRAEARREMARGQARLLDPEGAWSTALEQGAPLDLARFAEARERAERRRSDLKRTCAELQEKLSDLARVRALAIQAAREALGVAEAAASRSRKEIAELTAHHQRLQRESSAQQVAVAEGKARLAGEHLESTELAMAALGRDLDALGDVGPVDEAAVERQQTLTNELAARLHETEEELARARGALEQVGGAVVRERQVELARAIERETRREHEIGVEYEAWKLLAETLRETESAEGTHLGRALAGPVSRRFGELTGGRYGGLALGAHLEGALLNVAGSLREIHALSAGTQDQLATLLRLCVAEQLRTAIVLDDHLSQSDPARVAWFDSVLRAAAHKIQIVLITCRPSEVLSDSERPAGTEEAKTSAAGQLRAIDLTRVIRRFPGS